jgi:hypothetical protein
VEQGSLRRKFNIRSSMDLMLRQHRRVRSGLYIPTGLLSDRCEGFERHYICRESVDKDALISRHFFIRAICKHDGFLG